MPLKNTHADESADICRFEQQVEKSFGVFVFTLFDLSFESESFRPSSTCFLGHKLVQGMTRPPPPPMRNLVQPPCDVQNGPMTGQADANLRRPKAVYFWTNAEVMKWLKRHREELYGRYGQLFLDHEITGRSLVRMNDVTLKRMGIHEDQARDEICRLVTKLKLKTDIVEMKDLEKKRGDLSVSQAMVNGHS